MKSETETLPSRPSGRRRVLLVLDRSDAPDFVAPDLLKRAQGAPLDLVVLQVLPDWYMRPVEAVTKADLLHLASAWASDTLRVAVEVRRGEPVREILAAAHEHRVDLVLMPAHQGGLVDRLLHRSALEAIRRESSIPVLEIASAGSGVTR